MKLKIFLLLLILSPSICTANEYNFIGLHNTRTELQYNNSSVFLEPNQSAKVVSYDEVLSFLKNDTTENNKYVPNKYDCDGFASTLYNNAGNAGIKCKYVTVSYNNRSIGHAFNAFNTLDRGLIFVQSQGYDSFVNVSIGKEFVLHGVFNESYSFVFMEPHVIKSVNIYS